MLSRDLSSFADSSARILDKAKFAGVAVTTVTAEDLFELVTTLSWGVDRFGDDEQAARRRVAIATAGIFTTRDVPIALKSRKRR